MKKLNLTQQIQYNETVNKYQNIEIVKQTSHTCKRKINNVQSIKFENAKQPSHKRRRIGSKHKTHKTPAINKLNNLWNKLQNDRINEKEYQKKLKLYKIK